MKKCAICGKHVDSGMVVHSECVIANEELRKEANDNAALAMEAKLRVDKLEKENAELRARLENSIELPCKVGDTVWVSVNGGHTFHTAKLYGKNETGAYLVFVDDQVKDLVAAPLNHCFYDWFRVVYTREEAEAKLKELEQKQSHRPCVL